jgi:hypothetical protein
VKAAKPQILKEMINDDERLIISILEEKGKMLSGELYQEYSKRSQDPVGDRSFRDFVNHLAEINMLKAKDRKRGIKGRTRTISKA